MMMRHIGALLLAMLTVAPVLAGPMRIEIANETPVAINYLVGAFQGTVAGWGRTEVDAPGSPAAALISRDGTPKCILHASVQMQPPTVAQCEGTVSIEPPNPHPHSCHAFVVNQGQPTCKIHLFVTY